MSLFLEVGGGVHLFSHLDIAIVNKYFTQVGLWLSVVTPCGPVGSGDVLEEHCGASLWNFGDPLPDDTVSAHKNTVWMPPLVVLHTCQYNLFEETR